MKGREGGRGEKNIYIIYKLGMKQKAGDSTPGNLTREWGSLPIVLHHTASLELRSTLCRNSPSTEVFQTKKKPATTFTGTKYQQLSA